MVIESYKEAANKNTRVYEKLIHLLEQDQQQTGGQGAYGKGSYHY